MREAGYLETGSVCEAGKLVQGLGNGVPQAALLGRHLHLAHTSPVSHYCFELISCPHSLLLCKMHCDSSLQTCPIIF